MDRLELRLEPLSVEGRSLPPFARELIRDHSSCSTAPPISENRCAHGAALTLDLNSDGLIWLIYNRSAVIFRYSTSKSGRPSVCGTLEECYKLMTPASSLNYTAALLCALNASGMMNVAAACISPEGIFRYWNNAADNETFLDHTVPFAGQVASVLLSYGKDTFVAGTSTCGLFLISLNRDDRGKVVLVFSRQLSSGSDSRGDGGFVSGVSRRISSLLFQPSPSELNDADGQLVRLMSLELDVSVEKRSVLFSLSSTGHLDKWRMDGSGAAVLEWQTGNRLLEAAKFEFLDNIWNPQGMRRLRSDRTESIVVYFVDAAVHHGHREGEGVLLLLAAKNTTLSDNVVFALAYISELTNCPSDFHWFSRVCLDRNYNTPDELFNLRLGVPPKMQSSVDPLAFVSSSSLAKICCFRLSPYGTMEGAISKQKDSFYYDMSRKEDGDAWIATGFTRSDSVVFTERFGLRALRLLPNCCKRYRDFEAPSSVLLSVGLPSRGDVSMDEEYGSECSAAGDDLEQEKESAGSEDLLTKLKKAYIAFAQQRLADASQIVESLRAVGQGERANLAAALVHMARELADDCSTSSSSAAKLSSTTSLLVPNQFCDKRKGLEMLVKFLKNFDLWMKVAVPIKEAEFTLEDARLFFVELLEKVEFAFALYKALEKKQSDVVDEAMRGCVSSRDPTAVLDELRSRDVFFQQISEVDELFRHVQNVQKKVLAKYANDLGRIGDTLAKVSAVFQPALEQVLSKRKYGGIVWIGDVVLSSKVYAAVKLWTCRPSALDFLEDQFDVTAEILYKKFRSNVVLDNENQLANQLAFFAEFLIIDRRDHLEAAVHNNRAERLRYEAYRRQIIGRLIELNQLEPAKQLAERFRDFKSLIDVAERQESKTKRDSLLDQWKLLYGNEGFERALYEWFLEAGKPGEVFNQREAPSLHEFLDKSQAEMKWILELKNGNFTEAAEIAKELAVSERMLLSKKKSLLSVAKLSRIAADEDALFVEDCDRMLEIIEHQERLTPQVLSKLGYSVENQPPLSVNEIIKMTTAEPTATQWDFARVLDLAVDSDLQQRHVDEIWKAAISRDDWLAIVGQSDYFDAAKNTVFYKTVMALRVCGCDRERLGKVSPNWTELSKTVPKGVKVERWIKMAEELLIRGIGIEEKPDDAAALFED